MPGTNLEPIFFNSLPATSDAVFDILLFEFKSIRLADKFRKKGNGIKIIKHLIGEAKKLSIKIKNEYILKLPSVQDNLATAIKGLDEEVKDKFLSNMPDRIKNRVDKERQSLGKVRASVVREARKLILEEIRVLIESGQVQGEKS